MQLLCHFVRVGPIIAGLQSHSWTQGKKVPRQGRFDSPHTGQSRVRAGLMRAAAARSWPIFVLSSCEPFLLALKALWLQGNSRYRANLCLCDFPFGSEA